MLAGAVGGERRARSPPGTEPAGQSPAGAGAVEGAAPRARCRSRCPERGALERRGPERSGRAGEAAAGGW